MAELAHFSLLPIMAAIMIGLGLAAGDPQSNLVGKGCSPHMYVNATAFRDNLDSVLQFLFSNLSSDGFATTMQNKSGSRDPVFGLAVCRKYLSARNCSRCVQEAARQAEAYCPGVNGARIHFEGCFLRYENNIFFYQDVDGGEYKYCALTDDTYPQTSSEEVLDLSAQLISNASAKNGYAVESIDGSLYGLAQCWPSVNNSRCDTCLAQARTQLITCAPLGEGRGLEAGCFMRYSTYLFFPENKTSSSTHLTSSSGKSSSPLTPILVGSIGVTALLAVLCLVYIYRRIRHRSWKYDRADERLDCEL